MKNFEVGNEVYFQAYEEHEPINGKIKRKGKLNDLGRMQLNPDDDRIFYEVETLGQRPILFTVTTAEWLFSKKPWFFKCL
jgi:hypothetical protein